MPITFEIDYEKRQINAIAIGPISYPEIETHLSQEHKVLGLSYREFIDAREVVWKITPSDTRRIVALILDLNREVRFGRTAVLVATDHAYFLVFMFAYLVSDACEVMPFRHEQEAHTWLRQGTAQPSN
jgi:hypothetical protein